MHGIMGSREEAEDQVDPEQQDMVVPPFKGCWFIRIAWMP